MPIVNCNRRDLWVHAGFAGDGKATFALNVAYETVTQCESNVLYVTLEQPASTLQRKLYSIHSTTLAPRVGTTPLEYARIRREQLTGVEKAFYGEVVNDFDRNPEYGLFQVWEVTQGVTIEDIQLQAELVHRAMGLSLVIIDTGSGSLVEPKVKTGVYRDERNTVVQDAKRLASQFSSGDGIAILLLLHASRQGRDFAEANNGIYLLPAIYPHEAIEIVADHVTATFLDQELRDKGLIRFTNIENPDQGPIDLQTNLACSRIYPPSADILFFLGS